MTAGCSDRGLGAGPLLNTQTRNEKYQICRDFIPITESIQTKIKENEIICSSYIQRKTKDTEEHYGKEAWSCRLAHIHMSALVLTGP